MIKNIRHINTIIENLFNKKKVLSLDALHQEIVKIALEHNDKCLVSLSVELEQHVPNNSPKRYSIRAIITNNPHCFSKTSTDPNDLLKQIKSHYNGNDKPIEPSDVLLDITI